MALTALEFQTCAVLLEAARDGAPLEHLKKWMRSSKVPEQVWRPLYERLGLVVRVDGEGDNAEQYVFAPDNIVPFVPSRRRERQPYVRRSGGAA